METTPNIFNQAIDMRHTRHTRDDADDHFHDAARKILMGRLAFLLEYDGAGFCGWQTQRARNAKNTKANTVEGVFPILEKPGAKTSVQEALEYALYKVAGEKIAVTACGRTDTGVHATAQLVHADIPVARPLSAWTRGVNTYLPPTVSILWAAPVSPDFHARFSATARHYVYWLENRASRSALWAKKVGWYHRALNVEAMRVAAEMLLGTNDFSAFRAAECQAKSPIKTLTKSAVARHGDFISFAFSGNAFLHHMVRNIVGALIWIGIGKKPPEWIAELLATRNRAFSAPTFSPDGLYLCGVDYPQMFGLPITYRPPILGVL